MVRVLLWLPIQIEIKIAYKKKIALLSPAFLIPDQSVYRLGEGERSLVSQLGSR